MLDFQVSGCLHLYLFSAELQGPWLVSEFNFEEYPTASSRGDLVAILGVTPFCFRDSDSLKDLWFNLDPWLVFKEFSGIRQETSRCVGGFNTQRFSSEKEWSGSFPVLVSALTTVSVV